MRLKILLLVVVIFTVNYNNAKAQCANSSNIYSFVYNGNTYEVINENKTWIDAATCAVERGGWLAEINDVSEQNAIFSELNTHAGIITNNTVAPDGGGGSYVWIGGNDLLTEGTWVWDGNNDNNSIQFWQGTSTGNPVGGLFNNWGNEPDDWSGQDALALSLNGWPLGVAGEWNDVDHTNQLYFVVEYSGIVGIEEINSNEINIYPNPAKDIIFIDNGSQAIITNITIVDLLGKEVKEIPTLNSNNQTVDISELKSGIYFMSIFDNKKLIGYKKIIIN